MNAPKLSNRKERVIISSLRRFGNMRRAQREAGVSYWQVRRVRSSEPGQLAMLEFERRELERQHRREKELAAKKLHRLKRIELLRQRLVRDLAGMRLTQISAVEATIDRLMKG